MKHNLNDCTFIIPVRLESDDRRRNLKLILNYLLKNFDTSIIIAESDSVSQVPEILEAVSKNNNDISKIELLFYKTNSSLFHRTFYLNEMLMKSKTYITINYDCDVILPIDSYIKATKMCLDDKYDLVYPFGFGDNVQTRVLMNENIEIKFFESNNISLLKGFPWRAEYGFCQWFNTKSYISGFMENQSFLAYGAEDSERANRWKVLEYKVGRVEESPVFHLEHSRGLNSDNSNPYFINNEQLYNKLKNMSKEQLIEYYKNQEYYISRMENKTI